MSRRAVLATVGALVLVVAVVVGAVLAGQRAPADAGATPSTSASATDGRDDATTAPPPSPTPAPEAGAGEPGATAAPAPAGQAAPGADAAVVPLDAPATTDTGLVARVGAVEQVAGEAAGPGQVAGPAVRFTVTLENPSGAAAPLVGAVVNAYFGPERTPGIELAGPGASPFRAEVPPGGTATATYVFLRPPVDQPLVVELFAAAGGSAVTWSGEVAAP